MSETHVVRTPETDRYKIKVPTLLTDFSDYASQHAHGDVERTIYNLVAYGAGPYNNVFDKVNVLSGMRAHAQGVILDFGGMYLVTFFAYWATQFSGPSAGDVAPDRALRFVSLSKSGTAVATTVNGPTQGVDSGTWAGVCAAGDYLEIKQVNSDPAARSGASPLAHLTVTRLA